jgi:phosphate-selective porin OprO and OprP
MRKLRWAATLLALGLVTTAGTSTATAQTSSRPATDVGQGLFPYQLPPAPQPAATVGKVVSGPAAPTAPAVKPNSAQTAPVAAGVAVNRPAAPRASTFADQAQPVILPAQAASNPPIAPATPEPMLVGAPVGSSSGTPAASASPEKPSGANTTIGSGSDAVIFKFKPGDDHLLHMETANGLFKFYVGGRVQLDAVWMRTDDAVQASRTVGGIGKLDDAVNFRRARFDLAGEFYKNIDFRMQWDFINTVNVEPVGTTTPINTPAPTDLWVTFKNLPWIGNLRIGNQKPPISFEHLTSSRFLNFMERSLGFDAFVENQNNGFEMGISAFDTYLDERGTWALGVFKNTRSVFGWNVGDGEYDVTGRVTGLPIYENEGETLVHLGFGASHRDLDNDFDRIRARTLLRNGPAILHNIVGEVQTLGSSRTQVNPELVAVLGPWTFQSEYQRVWVADATTPITGNGPRTNHGTVQYQAAYAELLYFLTGEHRYYSKKQGVFGRVTPNENCTGFGDSTDCESHSGLGAWQVGARYSWLDLDNNGVRGGTIHDVTVGLNWFLNPYVKWQWNAEALYRNAPTQTHDGWVYGLGTRIAIDF